MAQIRKTIAQLEDDLGVPIVLLVAFDQTTQTEMVLRLRDLPADAILMVVAWLNARLST